MEPLDDLILGVNDQPLHPDSASDHRRVVLAMAHQARRTLHIYTRDLDPAVYDCDEIQEAFTQFLLRNKNCRLMILAQDTTRAVKQGHAILRVAEKLPSRVQIRLPSDDYRDYGAAFFVADVTGFIRQPVAGTYAAEASLSASFEARKLVQYFDEVWGRAAPDPQLRRLFL